MYIAQHWIVSTGNPCLIACFANESLVKGDRVLRQQQYKQLNYVVASGQLAMVSPLLKC